MSSIGRCTAPISMRLAELPTCVLGVWLSGCIRRVELRCISRTIVLSGSALAVVENGLYPSSSRDRVVVLPESQYYPPRLGQFTVRALVATTVRFELGGPPLAVRLREGSVRWTSMPEAPVDVDRDSCPGEDHVCSPLAGGDCSIRRSSAVRGGAIRIAGLTQASCLCVSCASCAPVRIPRTRGTRLGVARGRGRGWRCGRVRLREVSACSSCRVSAVCAAGGGWRRRGGAAGLPDGWCRPSVRVPRSLGCSGPPRVGHLVARRRHALLPDAVQIRRRWATGTGQVICVERTRNWWRRAPNTGLNHGVPDSAARTVAGLPRSRGAIRSRGQLLCRAKSRS